MADAQLIEISPHNPRSSDLIKIKEVLCNGGLVGLPTDTLYGLTVRMDAAGALARLRKFKELPKDAPILFVVDSADMAGRYWQSPLPDGLSKLMEVFWPGPLTLIYLARNCDKEASPDGTIAFRMPADPVLSELVRLCDVPLASTSANRHNTPPANYATEAMTYFRSGVDLWVDDGRILGGEPSTVFNAINGKLVRAGRIGASDIVKIWGNI